VLAVELDPSSVIIQIEVEATETSKTVPIRPDPEGAVAAGFEIGAIRADPAVVTLRGLPDALADVVEVVTEPIPIGGATSTINVQSALVLPPGTRLAEESEATTVTVEVRPAVVTRTFLLGLVCQGADAGVACLPQISQVSLTVRGTFAALDALDEADLSPVLNVTGLDPGEHQVTPTVVLPSGVERVALSPAQVTVVLQPPATPTPAPG